MDGISVSEFTVENLQPSRPDIGAMCRSPGQLYEVTATVDAVQGPVTPAIPFFIARADNGQNYRVALPRLRRLRASMA